MEVPSERTRELYRALGPLASGVFVSVQPIKSPRAVVAAEGMTRKDLTP